MFYKRDYSILSHYIEKPMFSLANKELIPSVENIRRGTMIFSQIDRYPSITNVTATKSICKYDMIQHIQNMKPCGKCHGAK